jgi:hypothetical protein
VACLPCVGAAQLAHFSLSSWYHSSPCIWWLAICVTRGQGEIIKRKEESLTKKGKFELCALCVRARGVPRVVPVLLLRDKEAVRHYTHTHDIQS